MPANIKIFPLSYDPHAAPRVCDLQASYEQEYAAVAQTASGHWYFQGVSDPSGFIYYDPDCDGAGSSGRWVLDEDAPSTTRASDLDNDGDCQYSADLNSCANANDGAVDSDGDDCRYYDAFPSDCGMYDDDTFSSNTMCCACGGGQEAFDAESVIPPLGEHTWEMYCSGDSSICTDSADGVGDSGGDGCEYYWGYPSECGAYDGGGFFANTMCCACGGGVNACYNTDFGVLDSYGDDCSEYSSNPSWCGFYDTSEFDSYSMCCACGGGYDGWWERRSLLLGVASPSADFEITGACRSEMNQVYAAIDDILPSGRWAYQGVTDSDVVVGYVSEENHDSDCGAFDSTTGLWVVNSIEYDPADGVCSYKAYVSASSTSEMNVPIGTHTWMSYCDSSVASAEAGSIGLTLVSTDSRRRLGADDEFSYSFDYSHENNGMCLCENPPSSDENPPSQKTSSPSMNSYLIAAAAGAGVS